MKDIPLIYDNIIDHFTIKGVILHKPWYNPYLHLSRTAEGKLTRIPAHLHNEYRSYQEAYKAIRKSQDAAYMDEKFGEIIKHHLSKSRRI